MHAIRSWLYVGKYIETTNLSYLHAYKIGAILELADNVEHAGIATLYIPVEDGATLSVKHIEAGVGFIRAQKALGCTVLVACGAGISRSATFAAAAIKEEEGISLADAMLAVRERHPQAMPHPKLYNSMSVYYAEPVTAWWH